MPPQIARAYIRLSRLREGEEKLSPDIQLDAARALCQVRGWNFDEESSKGYSDLDVSGYSVAWRDRPGLCQHFNDAKQGAFHRLIVSAVDRLGRNASDAMQCWDEFESLGVKLYSCREDCDTDSPYGLFLRNIMLSVAQMESTNSSARIRANVEKRAKLGRLHGGRLPFWLKRNDRGEIELREDEASLIRHAVALRLEGRSYVYITREINAAGFRTITTGKSYERSFIVKFLQKPDWIETMMGHAYTRRPGRYATDPRTKRRVSRGMAIKIENAYPAVIDEATGYQLLALRASAPKVNSDEDGVIRRNRISDKWMLNGILTCAICGSRMGVHSRKLPDRLRRTYICEANNAHPKGDHTRSLVDADMIEMAVILGLASQIRWLLERGPKAIAPAPKQRTVQDVDRELDRIVELYSRGGMPIENVERQAQKLTEEREQLLRDEVLARAKSERPAPQLNPNMTLQDIRELLRLLELKISYPIFLEGVCQPNRYNGEPRNLKPCVKMIFPEQGDPEDTYYIEYCLYSPLFRMEYRRERKYYQVCPLLNFERTISAPPEDVALARAILANGAQVAALQT